MNYGLGSQMNQVEIHYQHSHLPRPLCPAAAAFSSLSLGANVKGKESEKGGCICMEKEDIVQSITTPSY